MPSVDYLIGCEYSPAEDRLYMLAGSNSGSFAAFPLNWEAPYGAASVLPPTAVLSGGHDEASPSILLRLPPIGCSIGSPRLSDLQVVRAVLWPLAAGPHMVSGAEDSRLCAWGPSQQALPKPASSGGKTSAGPALKDKRLKPY